ncbi:MAG: DMT family transporter [Eubacteriaceae bacterium]|nr:DMT family transporter [Eubacteriaceae bacterium]
MNPSKFYTKKLNIVWIAGLCSILWGSAYPSVKIGYELYKILPGDISTKLVFAGYRFILAGSLVLSLYLVIYKTLKIPNKKELAELFLLGLFLTTFQYIFFYIGMGNTTGVNGAILNSAGIFFSVFLAHFLYKNDKLNASKIIGCIIGFIGVVIINFTSDFMKLDFNFFGDGFVIIAALVGSGGLIYSKKLSGSINTMIVTGYQLLFGGLLLTFIGNLTGGHLVNFTFKSTLLLLYMGLLSAAAFTLWTNLLKYNKVGKVSIYNFLVPVFGAFLSAVFLGESFFDLKNISALILVCVGIYIVNNKNN